MTQALRWGLLVVATIAVTVPLNLIGVPSAALFAGLAVGIALALAALAPPRMPRPAGVLAQGVLGVYIGTMVHRDAVSAIGSNWLIVLVITVATLLLSLLAGGLLGLHRDVSPLTGSLALVAGGASGLVAIARELGGDDRVVSVIQYLRVALVTATIPLVVTLIFHADRSHPAPAATESASAPWYLSAVMLAVIVAAGIVGGRWARLPGAGLLGPLALTVALELSGLSFGLSVPVVLVQAAYMVIGWQAGIAFTRESLRAIGRILPLALILIVVLGVATAGLGVVLANVTGATQLEGYLATSPGGVYAVLATAVETGSNVTFIIAAQVVRVLLMLFAAPLMARGMARLGRRFNVGSNRTTARPGPGERREACRPAA
ncbi:MULTISPECIES: AbrB family transcriptional regulator [Mycolicibacterium]|uniref:Ammonia monooxygenase n=1 Tax=Mycolicibacterium senegalense TaxID=1796 RepID=A0A378W2G2_9MYCO|nr:MULTISPECIES: AbrB family transcriptional regulator [Mycolicibacterium]MCV7337442.1 AbrB family transcriptional regulator [Mycolicibacterium senegalense]MDR7289118.1 membrane AbrB-like protein [Mycolicibacterium senegalense]QZA25994.1 AbrB family transcriptional regulator [Mycolicibacterium senegalense]QZH58006.1 AbrB family transcriptional regulator [Mycolicibacterium farcinogenes]CDP84598.1 ammonia monooxygenase [Mycolicibacterium farcinogenes]